MFATRANAVVFGSVAVAILMTAVFAEIAGTQSRVPPPTFSTYCELHYVKRDVTLGGPTPGFDLGSLSLFQGDGRYLGAIFADFTGPRVSRDNMGINLCAVRDLSTPHVPAAIPGGPPPGTVNLCTGVVCIGKLWAGQNRIDFVGFNASAGNGMGIHPTATPDYGGPGYMAPPLNGAPGWLDPLRSGVGGVPYPTYQIATAFGRTEDMDVAIGLTTNQLESWLITSESAGGAYSLVAYYLSTMAMFGSPPVSTAAALTYTLPQNWVVDDLLVLSSAVSNTAWVVFIDSQNPTNPVAHTIPFTLGLNGGAGSGWGTIDPPGNPHWIPSTPPSGLPLTGLFPPPKQLGTVVGMWEAQNPLGVGTCGYVGISFANPTTPTAPGDFVVVAAQTPLPAHVGVPAIGGGPVSHVCTQAAAGPSGIALETVGGTPIGSGWYLVTPLAQGTYILGAIDTSGNIAYTAGGAPTIPYLISYPVGATPTGVPMAHPGDVWNPLQPVPSTNFVAVPYLDATAVDRFHVAFPATNGYYTGGTGIQMTVFWNWGLVPPFPVQHFPPPPPTAWPGLLLFKARTNYRPEYALYFPGW